MTSPEHSAVAGRTYAAASALVAEAVAGWWHPALAAVLAAADVVIPVVLVLILITAILRGSTETCERTFRLLRWITGRPEPPAPSVVSLIGGVDPIAAMPNSEPASAACKPAGQ